VSYEINRERFRHAWAVADRALSLAVRLAALADEIEALHEDIPAADEESVRGAGFRSATAIGSVRQASAEMGDTADHLERVAATMRPGSCLVQWGVRPEYGNTLSCTRRTTRCRVPGCGRTWPFDRVGLPCIEPARWQVTDQGGRITLIATAMPRRPGCLIGAQIKLREELA
jgi:hypothetical protein